MFAVDLRGFGNSAPAETGYNSAVAAEDLHALIRHLDVGPVHIAGQDIAGGAIYRLATEHPADVASVTAIEMGLAGFGLEGFADVTRGGSWHIGTLAAPGIPDLLFSGRERELLREWAFPSMTAVAGAVTSADIEEFARGYARRGGWASLSRRLTSWHPRSSRFSRRSTADSRRGPSTRPGTTASIASCTYP